MKKITLNEVVQKMLAFQGRDRVSMLGIGPMSKNLIKASMLLAKEKDFPLMFIASRNQVDADELGGGYVCNWNQERFAAAIKETAAEIGYDGLYYVLMGRLTPLSGIGPKDLGFERVLQRITEHPVEEVIIATNFTAEGETTAHYLAEMLRGKPAPEKVQQVAQSIGMFIILGLLLFANGMDFIRAIFN